MTNATTGLLMALFSVSMAYGQNAPVLVQAPATKLEAFAARKNTVITTESYFAGVVTGEGCTVRLQAIVMYDANREAYKVRGMRIDLREAPRTKEERDIVSYVDLDELDGLSRAITAMLDLTRKGSSLPNPITKEQSFSTVGGFTLTMVQRETDRQLHVTQTFAPGATCTISRSSSIDELKMEIDKVVQSFH
jgi:hypothetical protein